MAFSFQGNLLHFSTPVSRETCSADHQITTGWSQTGKVQKVQKVQFSLRPAMYALGTKTSSRPFIVCQASEKDVVERSRSMQLSASALLAELLKADDVRGRVVENLDLINEEFFTIASTYVDMAAKEGNVEVVKNLQNTLAIAMEEKNKTLRPEIRLLNELLKEKTGGERIKVIQANLQYLEADSYFFILLNSFTMDVERTPNSPKKSELLVQLKSIARETKEASLGVKKTPKRGFGGSK